MRPRAIDRGWRGAATSVFVALALLTSLATAPSVLAVPRLILAPSNGAPGATVRATANDFPAGTVHFTWDGSVALGSAESDGQRAILNFEIPAGAAPGEHLVRACGSEPCTGSDPQDEGTVTVTAVPTPTPPTPPPTAPPTPAPTPRITPRPPAPTPRATSPAPTPRPPSSTPGPSVGPSATGAGASPSPSGSAVASPVGSLAPTTSPAASAGGVLTPTAIPAEPSATPANVPAGPASELDSLAARMVVPVALIGALILAGFVAAKVKGRPVASEDAGAAMASGTEIGRPHPGPTGPPQAVPPAEAPTGSPPAAQSRDTTATPDAAADPWANARTIAVHVEHIDEVDD